MKKLSSVIVALLTGLVLTGSAQVRSSVAVAIQIQTQLAAGADMAALNYPLSVIRLYSESRFAPVWVNDGNGTDDKWQAMLLIDCVLQYGLLPADYHPKELMYDKLHAIFETPDKVSDEQKARFDIMLTDAMVTMINNLHYGKLNPNYGQPVLDNGQGLPFNAEKELRAILLQPDFKTGVLNVQPRSKMYADLQYKMRQLKGQYDGDCYSVPEETVRKVAINMERLRWAEIDDNVAYVQVNIPSFKLTYHLPDTARVFKVIVGSPANPTPVLQSSITYFTTAPEWKAPHNIFTKEILPKAIKNPAYLDQNDMTIYDANGVIEKPTRETLLQIQKAPKGYFVNQASGCDNALGLLVFRFKNVYSVYLHDTPDKSLFNRTRRDLSHGCIRVENPGEFAALLLKNDEQEKQIGLLKRSMANEKRRDFVLTKPMPVKITYITCQIIDGELVSYDDIYKLDRGLEMALYNVSDALTLR
jgi:murein L,D-transpeptidase YcbB/YkuD